MANVTTVQYVLSQIVRRGSLTLTIDNFLAHYNSNDSIGARSPPLRNVDLGIQEEDLRDGAWRLNISVKSRKVHT